MELEDYRQEISENPQYTAIIEEAFSLIKGMNISVNGYTSTEAPDMPHDITNLMDQDLGELLNRHVQWAGYIEQKLAEYSSYFTVVENELEFVTAVLHNEYLQHDNAKAIKVTERKELVKTDKRYIIVNREKLKYEVVCNILKANLNATNNICFNISRQISLKGQDEQRQYRNNNVNNMVRSNVPGQLKPKVLLNAPIGEQHVAKRSVRK